MPAHFKMVFNYIYIYFYIKLQLHFLCTSEESRAYPTSQS